MGFSASVAQKMELEPKNEGGEGGGEGVFFLSSSPPPCSFVCPVFFFDDSHSSFSSPKPHRNACYAVYS